MYEFIPKLGQLRDDVLFGDVWEHPDLGKRDRGGDGDGDPATQAGLERPHGCGIDPQGHLYIADGMNHRVRVVGMWV